LHDNRLDKRFDVVLAGEVRPQLGPFRGIEAALKKRAENRGVNRAPV